MPNIKKAGHLIEVEIHPQPFGYKLFEAMAPDGYKWAGDSWSIHGERMADLRARVEMTDLEEASDDEDL
jgi:hypothetical protein